MNYIIMLIAHIIKSAEYFIDTGLPVITAEQLPYLLEALGYNLIKLAEIYLSGFV